MRYLMAGKFDTSEVRSGAMAISEILGEYFLPIECHYVFDVTHLYRGLWVVSLGTMLFEVFGFVWG